MVKLDGDPLVVGYKNGKRIVKCSLVADTATDLQNVGTSGKNVSGLNDDDIIDWGSDCFTCEQELLMLDSSGNWK